jgi:hypothetical protein
MLLNLLAILLAARPGLSGPLPRQDWESTAAICNYTFSLTSSGSMSYTVGRLSDGQLRLNGSYAPEVYCLDEQGRMLDSESFGCIITGSSHTRY